MTALHQVQPHPASIDAYIRHGWSLVPIPPGSKGPKTTAWNLRQNALKSQADLPPGWGIGIAHAFSGTMALDIDSWDSASAMLGMFGVNLQALYDAPDAVIIDSGRAGRGKLLYTMPAGLVLPSRKIASGGETIYELRCATVNGLTVQDVAPPSIHPQTMQPYRWAGRGHWTRTPTIPTELLSLWQSLINADKRQSIMTTTRVNASWDEVASALYAVSPDCSYDEWITCGMALHYAGVDTGNLDHGLHIWDQWSQGSPKYPGEADLINHWRSFRTDKAISVRLGSLFQLAYANGWERPAPDVTHLFPAVDPTAPDDLLDIYKMPAPVPDQSLFPKVLVQRAIDLGEAVGCDPLVPLFSGLAAISGVMDARTRLELKQGFEVPPVLWIMTIGEPADKKTPGSKPMLRTISQLQDEDKKRIGKDILNYEVQMVQYDLAKKAFMDHCKNPETMMSNTPPPPMPPAPAEPVELKVIVQDITSQRLVRQCAKRPRGVLLHLDEMNSWVDKICDTKSGEDRSAWTVSYESSSYEMDRVGAGTVFAENFAVSIYGNVQPQVYELKSAAMASDGLLQRFIIVPLRPQSSQKGKPKPEHLLSEQPWENVVRSVFALPAMTYRLSPGAAQAFDEFQDWYEVIKNSERTLVSSPRYMTALGKAEGLCGRICLVLHAMLDPYNIMVPEATMANAVEIMKGYIIPALRYAHETDVDGLGRWLTEYVLYHSEKATLSLSDLRHATRKQSQHLTPQQRAQAILGVMRDLEDAKWVARIDDGANEHKMLAQWAINPALKERFAKQRKAVTKAKQVVHNWIHRDNFKPPSKIKYAEMLDDDDE